MIALRRNGQSDRDEYDYARDGFEWVDYSNRAFGVRKTNDEDEWFFAPPERDLWRSLRQLVALVTIVDFRYGHRWIFMERTRDFPDGFKDTDGHARARLWVLERAKAKLRAAQ
jgi:hypothetical protein